MNRNEKLRDKLFSIYSLNINQIYEHQGWARVYKKDDGEIQELKDFYLCPICGHLFLRAALRQELANPLSLEDIPPVKLGGKKLLLTCKSCNNNLGGKKLDSKLIWDLDIRPFVEKKPNSQIDVYYNINKRASTRGKLVFLKKGKYGIDLGTKLHPKLKDELTYMKSNWKDSNITFSFQAPSQRIVNLALLRIAYLKMIAYFGFGYYFNPSAIKIQEQLFKPEVKLLPNFGIPNFNPFPVSQRGIFFIKSPANIKSFLVVFDLKHKEETRTYSVFIPGPNEDCLELYSTLARIKSLKVDIELINEYSEFPFLKDRFAYNKIWLENE